VASDILRLYHPLQCAGLGGHQQGHEGKRMSMFFFISSKVCKEYVVIAPPNIDHY
jgi:hypothetical protein